MKRSSLLSISLLALVACGEPPSPRADDAPTTSITTVDSALASADMAVASEEAVEAPQQILEALMRTEGARGEALLLAQDVLTDDFVCAEVSLDQVARRLTVDFGEGCSIGDADYAGRFTVEVTVDPIDEVATFVIQLDELTVDGATVSGVVTYTAEKPGVRSVQMQLQFANDDLVADLSASRVRVVGQAGSQLDVTSTLEGTIAGVPFEGSYEATDVLRDRGDCAPHAGTIDVAFTLLIANPLHPIHSIGPAFIEETHVATMTFTSDTPQTGEVEVIVDGEVKTVVLPSCQPTRPDLTRVIEMSNRRLQGGQP